MKIDKIIIELKVTRPGKEPKIKLVEAINDEYAEQAISEIQDIMWATTQEDL